MDFKCKVLNMYKNGSGKGVVEIATSNISALQELEQIKDKELDVEIKVHRKKRSLNANAYLWYLVNALANELGSAKEEVYLLMLKRYGQSEIVSIKTGIDVTGYFKYYEEIGTGKVNGTLFTHYKIFKGSSEYDTKEMSVLLNGVVDECKMVEIPTKEDREIAEMLKEWAI